MNTPVFHSAVLRKSSLSQGIPMSTVDMVTLIDQDEILSGAMFEEIVGSSKTLLRTLEHVVRVAPTDSTVLITGEAGPAKNWSPVPYTSARGARSPLCPRQLRANGFLSKPVRCQDLLNAITSATSSRS